MRAHAKHTRLRFEGTRDPQKPFAVLRMVPPILEIRKDPARTFDPIDARDRKTSLRSLLAQLIRMMEEGIHEINRLPGWIAMLTVLQVLIADLCELRIFQVSVAQAIERGRKA